MAIERENQVVKPNFLAPGWVKKGTAATGSYVEEHFHDGTSATARAFKAVCAGSATTEGAEVPAASFVPVLKPSTKYTVSIYVWVAEADAGKKVQGLFQEQTSAGSFVANQFSAEVTLVSGFNRITLTATSGATAAKLAAQVYATAKVTMTMWLSSAMLEYTATAGEYFDGGIAPAGKKTGWTGTANESTSYLEPAPKTLSLTDSTTPTESLTKKVTKGLADSTTPTESWNFELIGPEPEPEPEPAAPRTSVREFPRLDLHYEIEAPNGRFYRWAKDEPNAENVPSGSGFTTTDHGGFDSQNLTLPRKPGVEYADLKRLSTVRALGAGGEVACETRLKEAPRTSGDQIAVSPVAEGWIEHLNDDSTAAEIYRDVDLSGWGEPGRSEQARVEAANFPPAGNSEVVTDVTNGIPALRLAFEGPWGSPVIPLAEAWYDAGPSALVAKVYIDFVGGAFTTTAFTLQWGSGSEDLAAGQYSGDIFTATSGFVGAEPVPRRFFHFEWYYSSTPAGAASIKYSVDLRHLVVYGNHGLAIQGNDPEAGFLGSQILENALSRWAPLLNFSTGSSGSIRPGTFVIPHLAFKEQTTTLAILEAVNRLELRTYGCWENRTFFWQEWGDGRKWRARVAPTQLSETGPSTDRLQNGVLLRWNDVDGTSKSAGPIGSGSDIESAELEDRDPENPANQIGSRMWGTPYDLGIVTVDSEAVRMGTLLLARLKEVDRSGQAQIVGVCEDDRGILRPYWQVRAGDTIVFVDAADTSERKIIATQSDDDSKVNTITLDAPATGVEDLLAQLGVSNAALGL